MSTPLSYADNVHTLTSDAVIPLTAGLVRSYQDVSNTLNQIAPISSIAFSTGSFTITMKDARVLPVASQTGPKYKVTSTDFWSLGEFALVNQIGQLIIAMVPAGGLTTLTDTYN